MTRQTCDEKRRPAPQCDHPDCIGAVVGWVERAVGPAYCAGHREWAEAVHFEHLCEIDAWLASPEGQRAEQEEQEWQARAYQESSTSSSASQGRSKLRVCEK